MSPKGTTLDKPAAAELESQDRATELTDAIFSRARRNQESSFQMARQFVDLVDVVLPVQGGEDSHRRRLIDGVFDLADRAASTPLEMMRSAIQNAVHVYVNVDVAAFNGVDVAVDVTVPTDVGAFKSQSNPLGRD